MSLVQLLSLPLATLLALPLSRVPSPATSAIVLPTVENLATSMSLQPLNISPSRTSLFVAYSLSLLAQPSITSPSNRHKKSLLRSVRATLLPLLRRLLYWRRTNPISTFSLVTIVARMTRSSVVL